MAGDELVERALDEAIEQRLLGREVEVERRPRDLGRRGDLGDRRLVEPPLAEQDLGLGEQPLLAEVAA